MLEIVLAIAQAAAALLLFFFVLALFDPPVQFLYPLVYAYRRRFPRPTSMQPSAA